MNHTLEPLPFRLMGDLLLSLYDLAALAARTASKRIRKGKRQRCTSLKPGPTTPMWNELVNQALPYLTKRGSKVRLARYLGLPRQRLQVCLKAKEACFDAERTLLLLCWVTARQQGREVDL
jgi:hypothetical protein